MREETTPGNSELAFARMVLALERTIMAWIRTAISMISLDFTIYKFFQEFKYTNDGEQRLLTPGVVGMVMILFGWVALELDQVQT